MTPSPSPLPSLSTSLAPSLSPAPSVSPAPSLSPASFLGLELGNWAEWIAAVATVCTFIGFGLALLWEVRARRADEKRLEIERAGIEMKRRRSQAEGITYYLQAQPQPAGPPPTSSDRAPLDAVEFGSPIFMQDLKYGWLVIVNNSGSCIYNTVAVLSKLPEPMNYRGIGVIPPGETRISMPMKDVEHGGSTALRRIGDFVNNKLVESVHFNDEAGVAWSRSNSGRLTELHEPIVFPDGSP